LEKRKNIEGKAMLENGVRLAGRYEIVQLIGGGGMANVYQAKDLLLDRWVAIKVMSESLRDQNEFIQRFIREAKAAGSLSHPNVVSIYDIGREKMTYFMVMEYVEGMSLAEYFFEQESLPLEDVIDIGIQICKGLSHAHRNGIVHRDIKLQNIMRTKEGDYKITDFGISSVSHMNTTLTQTGTVMGSAHYFSPEQASGGRVSYTSDLYSLGVLLFKLLTDAFPFDADNSVSIALKHLQEEMPDPRELNDEVPPGLVKVLKKALAKKPKERFQTADEMMAALERVKKEISFDHTTVYRLDKTVARPSRPTSRTSRHKVDHSRKKVVFISMAVLASMMVAVFAFADSLLGSNQEMSAADKAPYRETIQRVSADGQAKEEIKGDHPWWKEFPKKKYLSNQYFKGLQVNGRDGQYDVSIQVGPIPEKSFFYNIYVVDSFSSRLVLKDRQVFLPAKRNSSGYTPVQFPVKLPSALLPNEGLLKIEIFRLDQAGEKLNPTDNLLQQWGSPPPDAKISPHLQPGTPS
jgi:serine/threonine protein kinase